jgi:hypothetical protein
VAREYARIRISIASDEAIESLSPAAQWLYFRVLVPEPTLSHCGVADWRPARLLGKARGVTRDYITAAAYELEKGRHVLFDTATEECLVRAYIRTEELLRNPKMAVAMIASYHAVASKTLRAAIVSEVQRANTEHPEYSSWKAGDVSVQLGEIMASKSSIEVPYVDTITNPKTIRNGNHQSVPNGNGETVPITNSDPGADYQSDSVPIPCNSFPTDTSMQLKEGGYESSEGHQGANPVTGPPPTRFCPTHPNGTPDGCLDCQHHREAFEHWQRQSRQAAIDARRAELDQAAIDRAIEIAECELCDDDGYRGAVVCDHREHSTPEGRAAAMARGRRGHARRNHDRGAPMTCVCGHWLHSRECFCGCVIYEPDDGTDGSTENPGPRHNSDRYEGQYGSERKYSA